MTLFEQILKGFFKTLSEKELVRIKVLLDLVSTEKETYETKVKNFWDKHSNPNFQKKIAPPSIPSREDIKIYREFFLVNEVKGAVLLLGSTPALRDMLSELGIKNYVVADFSFKMIGTGLLLVKKATAENEIWLKAEWTQMPLSLGIFDCILGDLVFMQKVPENQSKFLKKIASLLRPNGIFITRTHIANTGLKTTPLGKILKGAGDHLNSDSWPSYFFAAMFRLKDKFRSENSTTSSQTIIEALAGYSPTNEKERLIIQKLIRAFVKRAESNLEYVIQEKTELENLINKNFAIAATKHANDYPDAEYFPIYSLKLPPQSF